MWVNKLFAKKLHWKLKINVRCADLTALNKIVVVYENRTGSQSLSVVHTMNKHDVYYQIYFKK